MPFQNSNASIGFSQREDYNTEARIEKESWAIMAALNNLTSNNIYYTDKLLVAKIIGVLSKMEYFLIKYKKDVSDFEDKKQIIIAMGGSSSYVLSDIMNEAITRFSEQAGKELQFRISLFKKPPYIVDPEKYGKKQKGDNDE